MTANEAIVGRTAAIAAADRLVVVVGHPLPCAVATRLVRISIVATVTATETATATTTATLVAIGTALVVLTTVVTVTVIGR